MRYLISYSVFLEFGLNLHGLVKAAHEDKAFDIAFIIVFDSNWTHQIHIKYFLGGAKITDMVNTISANHLQLKFPNFRRPIIIQPIFEKLFSIGSVT